MPKDKSLIGSDPKFLIYLAGGVAIGAALGFFSSQHLAAGMWMVLLGIIVFIGYRYQEQRVSEFTPKVELLPKSMREPTQTWIKNFEYTRELVRWTGNGCFTGAVGIIYLEGFHRFLPATFYPLGWMLAGMGCATRLILPAWAQEAERYYRKLNLLIVQNEESRKSTGLEGDDVEGSTKPAKKRSPLHSSQTVEDLIPRGRSIEEEKFRDGLIAILKSDGEVLPPSDTPLGKLWKLVNSKQSTIDDLGAVVEQDPALVVLLFRTANSAVYAGNAEKVTDIKEAIRRLGFSQLREIVFNAGVIDQFSELSLPDGWEGFWLRNILIARLTERICSKYFNTNGTEYLAGLLHDSGLIFLASFFAAQFEAIFSGEMSYLEAERNVLSMSHASISAAICLRSNLPERVVNAVIYHHNPMLLNVYTSETLCQSAQVLAVVLNICDKLADSALMPIGNTPSLSLEEIEQTPEVLWLSQFGAVELGKLLEEELPVAREIFGTYAKAPVAA